MKKDKRQPEGADKREGLRERLARMTPEELREAMRRTAEADRTDHAEQLAQITDDRAEVAAIMRERLPVLLEAAQEVASNSEDPDELARSMACEAQERNRPFHEAMWRACEEEHRMWEQWWDWYNALPWWKRLLSRLGLIHP